MRNLLVLLAISIGIFGWYYYGSGSYHSKEYNESGDIVFKNGKEEFIFKELGAFSAEVRVFGKTTLTGDDDNIAKYSLIASPLGDNERIFSKFMCEINSLKKASLINVIADSSSLERKIGSMKGKSGDERNCQTIEGKSLLLKNIYDEGADITNIQIQLLRALKQFNVDPRKYVLVTGLTPISCD